MMKVGVSNVKGGVAKTTNTINLSGAAATKGLDVLAVDSDPQGYLTQNLGFRDEFTRRDGPSFYDAWMSPKEVDVAKLIVEHEEGFDVLPANAEMFKLRRDLLADGYQLGKRLEQIFEGLPDYDLVIVDAPPDLGMINDNVLIATQNLIIPVEAEETSVIALEHLMGQIKELQTTYGIEIDERGVLVSNVNYPLDKEQRSMIDWIQRMFDGICPVGEIRNRTVIKKALKQDRSIFGHDDDSDQKETYLGMIEELQVTDDD